MQLEILSQDYKKKKLQISEPKPFQFLKWN